MGHTFDARNIEIWSFLCSLKFLLFHLLEHTVRVKQYIMTSKICPDFKKFVKYVVSKSLSRNQKVLHNIKKLIMTSKSSSWHKQKVSHEVKNMSWRLTVHHDITNRSNGLSRSKKYVMTSNSSPWRQNVRHYVKKVVITSQSVSWSLLTLSMTSNVRHDGKKFR